MRHLKRKRFNPAEYDYMDKMPLDGWFWEMIRRSSEYQTCFEKLEKKLTDARKKKGANPFRYPEYTEGKPVGKTCVAFWVQYADAYNLHYKGSKQKIENGIRRFLDTFLILNLESSIVGGLVIPKPHVRYVDFDFFTRPKIIGSEPVSVVMHT